MRRHVNLSEALKRAAEIGHDQAQKQHEKRIASAKKTDKSTMIRITLEITDPETAEAYRGKSPEIIANDLLHGTLMTACEVVSVEEGEPATPLHQLAKDWEIKAVALNDEAMKSPKHRERFFTMAGVFRACAVRLRQAMMEQKQSKP